MAPAALVVGAGLSGLAAAIELARSGLPVTVCEAAAHAGGRCRSFFDDRLDRRIDNGNHLILSGNRSAMAYLAAIGATGELHGPARAAFPFVDLRSGERWTIRPNGGRIPWWIFDPRRRAPGTRAADYARAARLAFAAAPATVAACVPAHGPAFERFWEPLTVAALNTPASEAAARLLWPVLRETFGRGEAACRPRIARTGLSETFVDPALAMLSGAGAGVRFHARVRAFDIAGERVERLLLSDGEAVPVGRRDIVVLAVPATIAAGLLPGLTTPEGVRPIVNAHFRLPHPSAEPRFIGVVGGLSQWIFIRGDVASVTVSAAADAVEAAAPGLLERMWAEVAVVLALNEPAPMAARLIKEKRATFAQTPGEIGRRPPCRTRLANLFLAGDWTDTGLPATIEGSVRSGHTAARQAMSTMATS